MYGRKNRFFGSCRCEELLDTGCDSPYLLGFLVELYKAQLEEIKEGDKVDLVKKVTGLCDKLAQVKFTSSSFL